MLPRCEVGGEPLMIAPGRASYFTISTLDTDFAKWSVAEMLRNYGGILISRTFMDTSGSAQLYPDVLQVASLNVATLRRVTNLKIEWIDEISGHLDFQTSIGVLK